MDVLFVSKFSTACTKLIKQVSALPELEASISFVYVDNKHIRKQIQTSSKMSINTVPCFIRMNEETGNMDVYEGEKAFDFFKSIQTKMEEQEREVERTQRYELELEKLRAEKRQAEEALAASQRPKKVHESPVQAMPIMSSTVAFTTIDELEEETPDENPNHPKGINTFVHIDKAELEPISVPKKDEKAGSLMTKAAKMQKERDSK